MHQDHVVTSLIHENFAHVMAFAYSRAGLTQALHDRGWHNLERSCFALAEVRADRALLELVTQLRVYDDLQELGDRLRANGQPPLGIVVQADNQRTDLHLRDFTNKVIHAVRFEWHWDGHRPGMICHSGDPRRWRQAEIDLLALAAVIEDLPL